MSGLSPEIEVGCFSVAQRFSAATRVSQG